MKVIVKTNKSCALFKDLLSHNDASKIHLLYKPRYVIQCVGKLTEEKFY
jgi:hypothetical protein